jgi:hypothetical protein
MVVMNEQEVALIETQCWHCWWWWWWWWMGTVAWNRHGHGIQLGSGLCLALAQSQSQSHLTVSARFPCPCQLPARHSSQSVHPPSPSRQGQAPEHAACLSVLAAACSMQLAEHPACARADACSSTITVAHGNGIKYLVLTYYNVITKVQTIIMILIIPFGWVQYAAG